MIDFTPIARFALLLVRPGMLVMAAPTFGGTYAPPQVRVGVTLLLALILAPVVDVPLVGPAVGLGIAVAREMAIGLALAMAVRTLIAGAEVAGHLSANQMGLSYGQIVDPQSGVRNDVLATLYSNMALLTFFLINGHHAFLRNLAASYAALPIGAGHIDPSLARATMEMLGLVFVMGVRLAAPLITVLLVVEVAMGLMSRAAPAMNLMVVSPPVRLLIGLLVIAVVVPLVPGIVTRFTTVAAQAGLAAARAFR